MKASSWRLPGIVLWVGSGMWAGSVKGCCFYIVFPPDTCVCVCAFLRSVTKVALFLLFNPPVDGDRARQDQNRFSSVVRNVVVIQPSSMFWSPSEDLGCCGSKCVCVCFSVGDAVKIKVWGGGGRCKRRNLRSAKEHHQ